LGARRHRRRRGEACPPDETLEALVARVAKGWIRTSGAQLTAITGRRRRSILVIEDDADVRTLIAEVCRLQGHDVLEAANGAEAIELGTTGHPDLVLVDWVLPDISGTEVILELRRQGVTSPMVMLTGRSTKTDEVVGLEVGADDYITKPFDSRILAARINAHLRRSALTEAGPGREGILTVGALQIDNAARRVKVGNEEIPLTMTEFNLLAVLAANPERVLTRAQLRDKVWGYPHDLDDHSVDPHVQRLRRKLSDLANPGLTLEAVPGLGYRLSIKNV
jgi:two-component system, OmpR family, alkaline phosphatase synthesis response regulator PhoP